MRTNVADFSIAPNARVRDAMRTIDGNGLGIVLVVDDGRLAGTLTDGDIRRAILAGGDLDGPVGPLMNATPQTLGDNVADAVVRTAMVDHAVRQIPALDADGHVVGLHFLPDLVAQTRPPAVIMAGGLGSRLGDLTSDTPKPLIEIGGKPILQHIVEHLGSNGVDNVFISTRYLAEQIEDYFQDGEEYGLSIEYIREKQRLGTAGALKYLDGKMKEPFLVMNGDLLTSFPVEELESFHREVGAQMTVCVRHYAMKVPFGVAEIEGSRLVGLSEKPTYDFFVNAGIYFLEPDVLSHIPIDEYFDMTELIEALIKAGGHVASFPVVERWLDVGRPDDLIAARDLLEEKRGAGE